MLKMFSESKKYVILMVIALSIFTDLAYARIVRDVADINNRGDMGDQNHQKNARGNGPIAIAGGIVNAIANLVLPHPENNNGNNAETTPNPESGTTGGDADKETADRESCPP